MEEVDYEWSGWTVRWILECALLNSVGYERCRDLVLRDLVGGTECGGFCVGRIDWFVLPVLSLVVAAFVCRDARSVGYRLGAPGSVLAVGCQCVGVYVDVSALDFGSLFCGFVFGSWVCGSFIAGQLELCRVL